MSVDARVDDQMRDVNMLGPEFAGHGLSHRAKSELGGREGGVTRATAQSSRRAREKDLPCFTGKHDARRFPASDETREAGQFPYLSEYPIGGIQDRKVDVGTDVEDA